MEVSPGLGQGNPVPAGDVGGTVVEMVGQCQQESEDKEKKQVEAAGLEKPGNEGAGGMKGEAQKEQKEPSGEVTDDGGKRIEDEEFFHCVSDSLWLTIVSVGLLVFCEAEGRLDRLGSLYGFRRWLRWSVLGVVL